MIRSQRRGRFAEGLLLEAASMNIDRWTTEAAYLARQLATGMAPRLGVAANVIEVAILETTSDLLDREKAEIAKVLTMVRERGGAAAPARVAEPPRQDVQPRLSDEVMGIIADYRVTSTKSLSAFCIKVGEAMGDKWKIRNAAGKFGEQKGFPKSADGKPWGEWSASQVQVCYQYILGLIGA